jgi:SAM-dependent methyltransferase
MDPLQEIRTVLSRATPERLEFTRKAFGLLPKLKKPRILDVGCGRGGPTIELARLSEGEVTGLDTDQPALDEVSAKITEEGLGDRIRVINTSMREMHFKDESFDIIWAEASVHVVGFDAGLHGWRRFLKPSGFLVIHEMVWLRAEPPKEYADYWRSISFRIGTIPEYVARIPAHGYDLIGHFALPADFWWEDYYGPLERMIREFRVKHAADRGILQALERQQREVDLYKKHPKWFGSAFFVMRKRAGAQERA